MKQASLYLTATALDKVRVREGNRPSFSILVLKIKRKQVFFNFLNEKIVKKSFALKLEYLILNVT